MGFQIAETPSAPATTVPVESEAPASEKVEEKVLEVAAVENGNKIIEETAKVADSTSKTNGLNDLKPELLEDMPKAKVEKAGAAPVATPEVAMPTAAPTTEEPSENNGQVSAAISADEDTKSSMASSMDEDSNCAKNHNNTHSAESVSLIL